VAAGEKPEGEQRVSDAGTHAHLDLFPPLSPVPPSSLPPVIRIVKKAEGERAAGRGRKGRTTRCTLLRA